MRRILTSLLCLALLSLVAGASRPVPMKGIAGLRPAAGLHIGAAKQRMAQRGARGPVRPRAISTLAGKSAAGAAKQRHTMAPLEPTQFGGLLVYSSAWGADTHFGIYSMDNQSNAYTLTAPNDDLGIYNAALVDGCLYTWNSDDYGWSASHCWAFDAQTGEVVDYYSSTKPEDAFLSMAQDPVSGDTYAYTMNASQNVVFAKFIPATREFQTIAVLGDNDIYAKNLAFDGNGQLWGVYGDGYLYKVDITTGAMTVAAEAPLLDGEYDSGMCIDTKANILYYFNSSGEAMGAGLACVDLSTMECEKLYDYDNFEQFLGVYCVNALGEPKAPAAATYVESYFEGASLSGEVYIGAPTTLFDGTPAEGEISWTLSAAGETLATGTANYGDDITVPVTVARSGNYNFCVVFTNDVGNSPKAYVNIVPYIGYDMPKPMENVYLSYVDGCLHLSWELPWQGANWGTLDTDNITYRVSLPDGTVVADGLTTTSWDKPYTITDTWERFQYQVSAVYEGQATEPVLSNVLGLGNVVPPYTNEINTADKFAQFSAWSATWQNWEYLPSYNCAYLGYLLVQSSNSWLFSPGISLEAGKQYPFSIDVAGSDSINSPRVEVLWGDDPTAAAMTRIVIDTTIVRNVVDRDNRDNYRTLTGRVVTTAAGRAYIGIHGCSDPDHGSLYVRNFRLGAAEAGVAPAAPEAMTIAPDAGGALGATISFTAPALDLVGQALTAIDSIEVWRGDVRIANLANPQPGAKLSVRDDNVPADSTYIYKAIAYNQYGASNAATATAFIGINIPNAPTGVAIAETANYGEVTMTWTAPEKDKDGNALDPAMLTYAIRTYNQSTKAFDDVLTGITACSATFRAVDEGRQDFVQYYVFACNKAGESGYAGTPVVAVGKPYATPYRESFADGSMTYPLQIERVNTPKTVAGLATDKSFTNTTSQDADNGLMYLQFDALEADCRVVTGKIHITAGDIFSYYYYEIAEDDANIGYCGIRTPAGDTELRRAANKDGGAKGWHRVAFDLTDYAGQDVQFYIGAVCKGYAYSMFDNIRIAPMADKDLGFLSFAHPAKVNAAEEFLLTVGLSNSGSQTAQDYTVELYRDGELADSKAGTPLAPGEMASVEFTQCARTAEGPAHCYQAQIAFEGNTSASAATSADSIAVKMPLWPAPQELTAGMDGDAVALEWQAPDLTITTEPATDDCEDYDGFLPAVAGDWSFIDADKAPTYLVGNVQFPGVGGPLSYLVVDNADPQLAGMTSLAAHSGQKCFMAIAAGAKSPTDPVPASDDWLISPRLDGSAQTITFWARSYDPMLESFEFLYSEGGKEIADFTKVGEVQDVPGDWTQYSFDVPEGARHFAVRHTSTDMFLFFLDDFTFTPASPAEGLSLTGYNVWRDQKQINEGRTEGTAYTDAKVKHGESHAYTVTALYNAGESVPSNVAAIDVATAIDCLGAAKAGVRIAGGKRTITVAGAAGKRVSVATADGKTLYDGTAGHILTLRAEAGVYVVKAGMRTQKVMVK